MSEDTKDAWDSFFDIASDIKDIVSEHEGDIKSLLGKDKTIHLEESDPLINVNKSDEKILIEMEMKEIDGETDLSFMFSDKKDELSVGGGRSKTKFMLPSDADVDEMDANLNNGVLSLEIPRTMKELDVNVVDKSDEDIEGGEEDGSD